MICKVFSYKLQFGKEYQIQVYVPQHKKGLYLKVNKSQKTFFLETQAQKTNEIFDKILPYEARAEFCLIFRLFFGQWSFKKKMFRDLLTFNLS